MFKFIAGMGFGYDVIDKPLRYVCQGLVTIVLFLLLGMATVATMAGASDYYGLSDLLSSDGDDAIDATEWYEVDPEEEAFLNALTPEEQLAEMPLTPELDQPVELPSEVLNYDGEGMTEEAQASWVCKTTGICI